MKNDSLGKSLTNIVMAAKRLAWRSVVTSFDKIDKMIDADLVSFHL